MKNTISIMLLIATGAAGYFYVYESWLEVGELREERAAYEEAIKQVGNFKDRKAELTRELESIPQREQDKLETLLPNDADALHILLDIDEFLSSRGYEVSNIDLGGAAVDGRESQTGDSAQGSSANDGSLGGRDTGYESTSISFEVSGSYNRLVTLLGDLQRSLQIFDVTQLSFEVNDQGENTYSITMHTYSLKE